MKKCIITVEQYTRLVKLGVIKENLEIKGGSNRVAKTFDKAVAGKDIRNTKYIPEEELIQGPKINFKNKPIQMSEEINGLLEYIYGLNESLSPFWESNGLSFDQVCETLESKGFLVKKNGGYKVSKKHGDAKTIKNSMCEALSQMIKPMDEDYPAGAEHDSSAPYNRPDPTQSTPERPTTRMVDIQYRNPEIAIFKDNHSGEMYVMYYGDIDHKLLEPYAVRSGFLDPDGDMEYDDDFEVDSDVLDAFVNDNFAKLSKGEGLDAFESGQFNLVVVDEELKDDLLRVYDKDGKLVNVLSPIAEEYVRTPEEEKNIVDKLKELKAKEAAAKNPPVPNQLDLELDEVTTAASSGQYTGLFSGDFIDPSEKKKTELPPVVAETTDGASVGNIAYDNPGLVGVSRDGQYSKNPKKTKAQKNTQWAGGSFVDIDDCTKLNNNKKAQNGGCSTGAVDNVVKLSKTNSNINAPSLSEGKKYSIYRIENVNLKESVKQLFESVEIDEGLALRQIGDRVEIFSDNPDPKRGGNETFYNRDKFKENKLFSWDNTKKVWFTTLDNKEIAARLVSDINKQKYGATEDYTVDKIIHELEIIQKEISTSQVDGESCAVNTTCSSKDGLHGRIQQFMEELANETDSDVIAVKIKEYLDFRKNFHKYSFSNSLLIMIQKPNATHVASFAAWKKVGRNVNKGAKGIAVFVPIFRKGEKPNNVNGEENDDALKMTGANPMTYIMGYVYDVSDTNGEDIPQVPQWWTDDDENEKAMKLTFYTQEAVKANGIMITSEPPRMGERGHSADGTINLVPTLKGTGKLSTLVHEFAHELLHWPKSKFFIGDEGRMNKQMVELQAESISYVVLRHYGLGELTKLNHANYLASWGQGGDKTKTAGDKVRQNLDVVTKVGQYIINEIDKIAEKK